MPDQKSRFEQAARDARPGGFDLVLVGTARYGAWDGLKGSGQDDAMQQYVDLADKLAG